MAFLPQPLPGQSGHHAVQFYACDKRLAVSIADFIGDGVAAGQPLVMIVTPEHRDLIVAELARRPFDVERLIARGECVVLDARSTLDRIMVDGMPDGRRFHAVVGQVIARIQKGREECVVRAYGEMVNLLWDEGSTDAAIRLEMLWNNLAMQYSFSLLCAYSLDHFYKAPGELHDVCSHHTQSEILSDQVVAY